MAARRKAAAQREHKESSLWEEGRLCSSHLLSSSLCLSLPLSALLLSALFYCHTALEEEEVYSLLLYALCCLEGTACFLSLSPLSLPPLSLTSLSPDSLSLPLSLWEEGRRKEAASLSSLSLSALATLLSASLGSSMRRPSPALPLLSPLGEGVALSASLLSKSCLLRAGKRQEASLLSLSSSSSLSWRFSLLSLSPAADQL